MKKITELGAEARDAGRNVVMAGLGVFATVNDTAVNMFNTLVEKGSGTSEKIKTPKVAEIPVVSRVTDFGKQAGEKVQDGFTTTLGRFGIPSRDEIQALTRSVEQLTDKVQNLQIKEA